MPKQKTNKSAAKRFSLSGKNKVKRNKAFGSHKLTSKNRSRKRKLRKRGYVHSSQEKTIKAIISR